MYYCIHIIFSFSAFVFSFFGNKMCRWQAQWLRLVEVSFYGVMFLVFDDISFFCSFLMITDQNNNQEIILFPRLCFKGGAERPTTTKQEEDQSRTKEEDHVCLPISELTSNTTINRSRNIHSSSYPILNLIQF